MLKRKRLDARSYREWHMAQTKKQKGLSGSVSEQGNMMSQDRDDKPEASCSRKRNSDSESLHSLQPREDSDSQSQPDNGEATLEQCSIPNVSPDIFEKKLSSVESGSDGKSNEEMEGESMSKQRPEELVSSPRHIEYWVPASFSHLQLEKYCETLIKHSMFLCSRNKKGLMDLQDVLVSARECCDHPYLVDSSLEHSLRERRPMVDLLTTGIEASGKLLLLDKFLQEAKRKGLRVLIVFQSNHSQSAVELRHILDDIIRQRLGEESYVHIYREFDRLKKLTACDLFNDKDSGKFVMLMEKYSCQPNIKLSAVDFVILFNSDWCPSSDIKCLRKMSIQSTGGKLKVLRLYTSNSLEEKALALAKEGRALESNMRPSIAISHMLLLWGATSLFSKLDEFHGHCSSIANLNCLTEDKVVPKVLDELLMVVSSQDGSDCSLSLISKVSEGYNDYHGAVSVQGERDEPARDNDIPPWAIWSSLLEGRNPGWRLLPRSSQKIRRRSEKPTSLFHFADREVEKELVKNKITRPSREKSPCRNKISRKIPRTATKTKAVKLTDHPKLAGAGNELSPCTGYNGARDVEETCMRRMRELLLKQKKEIREFYQSKKEDRAKLEEEHQLELDLINQGCTEAGAKQDELDRLHHIYKKKLDEYKAQMDVKRKELEEAQRASRIKEKQVKDNLIALSKTKTLERPISSVLSKSIHLEAIEQGTRDESVQHHDPGTPECLIEDTEVLSVESDGESDDDAVSMPRAAVPDTIDNNDSPRLPSNTASFSENIVEKTAQDMLPGPNRENEGDSSTNIEPCTETLLRSTVENQSYKDIGDSNIIPECPVSGPLESDGENDVVITSNGEAMEHGPNCCTSNEPQLCALSEQNHLEQVTNLENSGADDSSGRPSNGETRRSANEELANPATVNGPQDAQEQVPAEVPSSTLASSTQVVQQSQIGTTLDNSLQIEQPIVSACPPSTEVLQNVEAAAVSNFQIPENGSCQQDQNQFPSTSSATLPSLGLSPQSFVGRDQTQILPAGYPTNMQSPNSHFQDTSSVRSNMVSSYGMDPLLRELMRLKKEEEGAIKAHEEKTLYIKLACEKEMDEVRKKYDLLRQEADTVLLQKKVALESVCTKLRANKLLADTLKYYHQRPLSPLVSEEAILSAISELPPLQQSNIPTQRTAATSVAPTASQVQVVHQLSDLMSFDPVRLNSASPPSYATVNLLTSYSPRAPPPHLLRPYGMPTTPMLMTGIASAAERPSLTSSAWHGSAPGGTMHRQFVRRPHSDGTPYNPVVL